MKPQNEAEKVLADLASARTKIQQHESSSTTSQIKTRMNIFRLFWVQISVSAYVVWDRYISHVYGWLLWLFVDVFFSTFKRVWTKLVMVRIEGGQEKFSKQRGAYALIASIFLYYAASSIAVFIWDASLYVFTSRTDEVVYLSNAQEIIADENVFSVQGCEVGGVDEKFSCSENESLYFRIEPTWFNQAWSLIVHKGIFYPDYIAAPIAPGWQKCIVTSYGFRMKTMIRRWEIYPELLSARCEQM